ncbi:hypothetical protein BDDG_07011 [Blastomyces dermatitidis ATCC 18188]|uniref:Major facilitator superfamily (MFS) profile domain-containing protein n=1 Tax=Ajellomyces dermatitidis (strain ATCC 18188 / CBS 674.68) TaxID=653446 RepID=F2TLH7_AJEDA|nr:hypothetical protein BDDG_07011 [Blastomyces dermatitidis ATCC 18188]
MNTIRQLLAHVSESKLSTSLVPITNALDGFEKRDWIVTSYLLTYTGNVLHCRFLVVYAKLGDVFGRKTMFLLALALFTLFSILCGATNDVVELIIFRAFQGMGASGIYSMILAIAPTLVPQENANSWGYNWHEFSMEMDLPIESASGMCLYRDCDIIFAIINIVPDGCEVRRSFPGQGLQIGAEKSRCCWRGATPCIVHSARFALEEAGTRYSWSDAVIITTFSVGGIAGILFVFWELFLEKSTSLQEPVFPLRLLKKRVVAAMMATAFFTGFPFVAIVVNIPQRAQAVSGLSSVKAGLALLPLLLTSPLATAASGIFTSNFKIPPFYLILLGSVLQVIGVGLTCALPTKSFDVSPQQYGYKALMGLGFGLSLTTILTLAPLVIKDPDLGVTMGALTQVCVLGFRRH